MEIYSDNNYLLLILLWVSWCALHSILIANPVTNFIKARAGKIFRFYRLFYNAFSIVTLIPIILFSEYIPTVSLFGWDGYLVIIQISLILFAMFLFYAGSKHYDGSQFLGIRQIKDNSTTKVLTESGELNTSGILGYIRHPWYTGAIAIIWARDIDKVSIIVNLILTIYLIVGTILEEQKLVKEFGDQYRDYQKNVSMLLPLKWLNLKLRKVFANQ